MTDERPAADAPVLRFRVGAKVSAPPAARVVATGGLLVAAALWGVAVARDAGGVPWPLVAVGLGLLGAVLTSRLQVGTDITETGIRRRPGRRVVPWSDVAGVEPPGRWRDTTAVRTTAGEELELLGVHEDAGRRLEAFVAGREETPAELLAGWDDLVGVAGREPDGVPPDPTVVRGAWLEAAGGVSLAVAYAVPLLVGPAGRVLFSVAVLVALGLIVWGGRLRFVVSQR